MQLARCLLLLGFAGCIDDSDLQYGWDDRNVLCSQPIDNVTGDVSWDQITSLVTYAVDHRTVALMHAHVPGETITVDWLERVLDLAQHSGLAFYTFSELVPDGAMAPGIALCFDDQAVNAWYAQRDLLAAYRARVTFFVTRYARWADDERAELRELAAAGHDVQPHAVDHLNAVDYLEDHELAAYLSDEALPSITSLENDGYAVTSYAFPFGASSDELNTALLEYVRRVRVSPGSCPY